MIEAIFTAFEIAALLLFRFVVPATAVAVTCVAGWLVLPVGHYPTGSAEALLPYWITGAAVPSDMLLTKRPSTWRLQPELPLAVMVLMAVADALLNSFFSIN